MSAARGPLVIAGASGRAAAASARRAGYDPVVFDLFADADTKRLAPTRRLAFASYPDGFARLAATRPGVPLLLAGGLENYPDLVARLASGRDLIGSGPAAIARVRDTVAMNTMLKSRAMPFTETLPGDAPAPPGRWVWKPKVGAGGLGVRLAHPVDSDAGYVRQRFVPGRRMSAVFVTNGRRCRLIGAALQLVGTPWLHARPFGYAGNVGPVEPPVGLAELGTAISSWAGLHGLWGLDFISRNGVPVPVEVNPRYPASAEVYEQACGVALLDEPVPEVPQPARVVGKAVYYAPHRHTVPAGGPWEESLAHATAVWHRPDYADIPAAGTVIEVNQPVLTILAEADTPARCSARLKTRAAELDRLFGGSNQ